MKKILVLLVLLVVILLTVLISCSCSLNPTKDFDCTVEFVSAENEVFVITENGNEYSFFCENRDEFSAGEKITCVFEGWEANGYTIYDKIVDVR